MNIGDELSIQLYSLREYGDLDKTQQQSTFAAHFVEAAVDAELESLKAALAARTARSTSSACPLKDLISRPVVTSHSLSV